jgi:hypothetical protein
LSRYKVNLIASLKEREAGRAGDQDTRPCASELSTSPVCRPADSIDDNYDVEGVTLDETLAMEASKCEDGSYTGSDDSSATSHNFKELAIELSKDP